MRAATFVLVARVSIACVTALAPGCPVLAQETAGRLTLLDAARMTMASQPEIRVQQQQVDVSRANLRVAASQFDAQMNASLGRTRDVQPFTRSQVLQASGLFSSTLTNLTSYKVAFQKQLRSGLVMSPSAEVIRQDLNIQTPITNRANVWLAVTQPVMRGRGEAVVTAGEKAAALDVEASTFDLRHRVSATVERTALSYWNCVAADLNLQILQESETRAKRLVDEMQVLVDAGNRPAADMNQLRGNLVDRTTQRLGAEQGVYEARQNLGLAIGIPFDQIAALAPPGDSFPEIDPQALAIADAERLIAEALRRRADLQGFQRRESETRQQRVAAQDGIKPQVDLVAAVGYAGLDEGSGLSRLFSPLEGSGFNASVKVVYGWPVVNNKALGLLARTDAAHDQTVIQVNDLARTISSKVTVALNDLKRGAERIRSAREASAIYTSAVDDERLKLQIGLSTIIDLILTEDRLTRSRIEAVSAELSYAQALTRLRFETGMLVDGERAEAIPDDAFTSVPVATR